MTPQYPPLTCRYEKYRRRHTPTQAVESDVNLNQHIRHVKRRKFAGMVTGVDRNIGRIVKTLKETNMWKDTILWFLMHIFNG